MSNQNNPASVDPRTYFRMGGAELRALAAGGDAGAVAELQRRQDRRTTGGLVATQPLPLRTLPPIGSPEGRPARVLAALQAAVSGPYQAPAPVRLSLVPDPSSSPPSAPPRTEAPVTLPTDGTPAESWHVRGAPEGSLAHGRTYGSGGDAFGALGVLIAAYPELAPQVGTGAIALARGPWPSAVPEPSLPVRSQPLSLAGLADLEIGEPQNGPTVVTPSDVPSWDARAVGPAVSYTAPLVHVAPAAPDQGAAPLVQSYTAREHEFTQASADRVRAEEQHLASVAGLVLPPPVVQLGGTINSTGRENLARSHQDWASDPRTIDSCETLIERVKREQRIDVPIGRACDVSMCDDGSIRCVGWNQPLSLEENALRALVSDHSSVLPRAGQLMTLLPPPVRAAVWNAQVPTSLSTAPRVLRTRSCPGEGPGRAVFAAVSPGYAPLDADQVAGVVRDALLRVDGGAEARGEIGYNPGNTSTRIDALFHANNTVNFAAGDVFKLGARISTSDDGGGAVRVALLVWRNGCYNLIVVTCTQATLARVVHRGDRSAMVAAVQRGVRRVLDAGAPMLQRWGYMRGRPVTSVIANPSGDTATNVRALLAEFAGIRKQDKDGLPTDGLPTLIAGAIPDGVMLDPAGIERDVLCEMLFRGWSAEPGDTLADVTNAVTRLHREPIPVGLLRSAEEAAGTLTMGWGTATA